MNAINNYHYRTITDTQAKSRCGMSSDTSLEKPLNLGIVSSRHVWTPHNVVLIMVTVEQDNNVATFKVIAMKLLIATKWSERHSRKTRLTTNCSLAAD